LQVHVFQESSLIRTASPMGCKIAGGYRAHRCRVAGMQQLLIPLDQERRRAFVRPARSAR
jgi:hypothetical protein